MLDFNNQSRVSGTVVSVSARPMVELNTGDVLFNIDPLPFQNRVTSLTAQAAVYSEHFHHVAIMRKILLRMSSWMNYLFPFH